MLILSLYKPFGALICISYLAFFSLGAVLAYVFDAFVLIMTLPGGHQSPPPPHASLALMINSKNITQ